MKPTILVLAALAIAGAVAGLVIIMRPAANEAASPIARAARQSEPVGIGDKALPAAPLAEAPPAVAEAPPSAPPIPATESAAQPAEPVAAAKVLSAARSAARGGGQTKEPLQDPLAREALALVRLDPGAERYWYAAINDPDLSAHERQDLIEDLNEEGLSDPKHSAPEDVPLILSRFQLIEAAGPYAMDQVNADAFEEAYKDLMNLANVAVGGGRPLR
jgi:hypothetical protein